MLTTDREARITSWSSAAQRLLGFTAEEMLGKRFFDAVGARDTFGNRFCSRGCGFHDMVLAGESVRTFEMQVTDSKGALVRTFVSVAAEGGHRKGSLIYHLRLDLRRLTDRRHASDRRRLRGLGRGAVDPMSNGAAVAWGLSPREIQVLRCLAGGGDTEEISSQLGISATTVRNHVQRLLRKLSVHGRLEAIALAYRHKII